MPNPLLNLVWDQLSPADQQQVLRWMVDRVRLAPAVPLPPPAPPVVVPEPALRSRPRSAPPSATMPVPVPAVRTPPRPASVAAPPPPPTKHWWHVPEAAAYWGVSRSTVFRAIKLGRLPAYFVYQREYWIPGDCVDGQPFPSDTRVELPPHPSSVLSGMFQPAVDPVTPAWQAWLAGAATPWAPAQTGLRRSS